MKRTVRLAESFPGSTRVAVYRLRAKEPHFIIVGAPVAELDAARVADYMYACDWTDRESKGWITPEFLCDDFMSNDKAETSEHGEESSPTPCSARDRFTLDPESGFVYDRDTDEWLVTPEAVFDVMWPLLPNTTTRGVYPSSRTP